MSGETCTECDQRVNYAHGLCKPCYGAARRAGTLPPSIRHPQRPRVCEVPYCDRGATSKGLCEGHRGQQRRGVPFAPLMTPDERRKANGRPDCSVEGCGRVAERKGVCRHHRETRVVTTACRFPGCPHPHAAKGWCKGHWRADREGWPMKPIGVRGPRTPRDPNAAPKPSEPKPVSTLPAGWDKVTPQKRYARTKTSVRPDALGPLTPLDLGTVGATLALLERHNALDLADTLGLREMAADARARLAVAS